MTYSQADQRARKAAERLLNLLAEERIRDEIDNRIDRVVHGFLGRVAVPTTPTTRAFHGFLSEFVQTVYGHGLPVLQYLSSSQALAEGLSLLDQGYYSVSGRGYDAALADVIAPRGAGLSAVLIVVGAVIKSQQRQRYVAWVYATCLGFLDWQTQCEVAELLRERTLPFLPTAVRQWTPERLAGELPRLLALELALRNAMRAAAMYGSVFRGP